MERRIQLISLAAIVTIGMMFSSCGNIDIVKRKYRPGFHVDVTKKNQKPKGKKDQGAVDRRERTVKTFRQENTAATRTHRQAEQQQRRIVDESATASLETVPAVGPKTKKGKGREKVLKVMDELIVTPLKEMKRERMGRELRRSVFDRPEDKQGWSVVGFLATGFALLAFVFMIIAFMGIAISFSGVGFAFWWVFGIMGVLLGTAAMVMGIIGLRQTGYGEKRGRGFALAGMIGGILTMVLSLVALLWGALFWIINNDPSF